MRQSEKDMKGVFIFISMKTCGTQISCDTYLSRVCIIAALSECGLGDLIILVYYPIDIVETRKERDQTLYLTSANGRPQITTVISSS